MIAFSILILLIGIFLRFWIAIISPLWLDEATYYISSQNSIKNIVSGNHGNVTHPFLYTFILHYWQLLNNSEFFLRIPSLISSIVTLIFSYFLGKALINRYFGLILLIIFSISNFIIYLSWQANVYSFAVMFTLISIYLYFVKVNNFYNSMKLIFVNILGFLSDYGFMWLIIGYIISEFINYVLSIRKLKIFYKKRFFNIFSIFITCIFILWWNIVNFQKIPQYLQVLSWISRENMVKDALYSFVGVSNFLDLKTYVYLITMVSGLFLGLFYSNKISKFVNGLFMIFSLISIFFSFIFVYLFSILIQPILLARHLFLIEILLLIGLANFIFFFSRFKVLRIPYSGFIISNFILSLFIFLNLSGFLELSRIDIPQFNWKEVSKVIYENNKLNPDRKNILVDINGEQYNFQPLTYYLHRLFNKNLVSLNNFIIPDNFEDYRVILEQEENYDSYTLWVFDLRGDRLKITNFAEKIMCSRSAFFSNKGANYYKCENPRLI